MKKQPPIPIGFLLGITLLSAALLLAACTAATPTPAPTPPPAGLPNPASQNCEQVGGQLSIEPRGDGGQFGVCYFEENRQCEEWALLRGDCPVGGRKVTGYITQAGRYCAITGGEYTAKGDFNTDPEQGDCTFKNGKVCDVWDYYNGKCDPNS